MAMPEAGLTIKELLLKQGTRLNAKIAEEIACLVPDSEYCYIIQYVGEGQVQYRKLIVANGSLRESVMWYDSMEKYGEFKITGFFKILNRDLKSILFLNSHDCA